MSVIQKSISWILLQGRVYFYAYIGTSHSNVCSVQISTLQLQCRRLNIQASAAFKLWHYSFSSILPTFECCQSLNAAHSNFGSIQTLAGTTYLEELLLQCRRWNVGGAKGAMVAHFQASVVPTYALDSTLPCFSAVKMLFERNVFKSSHVHYQSQFFKLVMFFLFFCCLLQSYNNFLIPGKTCV